MTDPIMLSLQLATLTTFLLLVVGIPLAHWIAYSSFRLKPFIQAIVALPLVLPPTVLGFYLLLAFSPNSALGQFLLDRFGLQFVFSFEGLVLASMIYSLPFMVQPLASGMQQIPSSLLEASTLMGKSKIVTLCKVILPSMVGAVLTSIVLTFASVLGEFGVVLMIGGNIPNETRVASIALYDQVEALQYEEAHRYAAVLLFGTFVALAGLFYFNREYNIQPSR